MTQPRTNAPGVMRAAEYDRYGPAAVLQIRTVDRPRPGPGQALVRVLASSVNPLDTIVRSGRLRLLLGDDDLTLLPGEVVEFDTHVPHWFGSTDEAPAEVLVLFGPQGERMHVRARPRVR